MAVTHKAVGPTFLKRQLTLKPVTAVSAAKSRGFPRKMPRRTRKGRPRKTKSSLSTPATAATPEETISPACADVDTCPIGEETHVLEHQMMYGDTEVVDEDLEEPERTAVIYDDDDDSFQCTLPLMTSLSESSEKDFYRNAGGNDFYRDAEALVAADIGGSGPVKKSFTEVRVASLRASGLLAARRATPMISDLEKNSTDCDHRDNPVDYCEDQHADESKNRNVSHIARKLNFEETFVMAIPSDKMIDSETLASQCSDSVGKFSMGLRYTFSQEPGEKMQADALEAVDNFLFINDVGLSQDFNIEKSVDSTKSPVHSAAGSHFPLKMNVPRSPVASSRIFDWVDSLEDDGGGHFFMKRKDFLLGNNKHSKNSNSVSKTPRLVGVTFDKFSSTDSMSAPLAFSETRSKQQSDASLNVEISSIKHSKETNLQRGEGMSDTGQDTQVAAEAMEALCTRPFHCHADIAGDSSYAPQKMENISSNHEGSVKRTPRSKMLHDVNGEQVTEKSSMENKSRKRGRRKSAVVMHEKEHVDMKCHEPPNVGGSVGSLFIDDQPLSSNTRVLRRNSLRKTTVAQQMRNSKENTGSRHGKQSMDYEISEKGKTEAKPAGIKRKHSRTMISQPKTGGRTDYDRSNVNFSHSPVIFSNSAGTSKKGHVIPSINEVVGTTNSVFCSEVHTAVKTIPSSRLETSKEAVQNLSDQDVQEKEHQTFCLTSVSPCIKLSNSLPVCTIEVSPRKKCERQSVARELIKLKRNTRVTPNSDFRNPRRRGTASIRVCLSHHLDDVMIKQQKRILGCLGISSVDRVSEATHFIADKFSRTRNMLEAIAAGKPVVSHQWLESCRKAHCIVDEKNYILRDEKERELGFTMPDSLSRALQAPLLQGKRVFITPNVKPSRELIADIVRAAKGQPVERVGRCGINSGMPENLLVVSCEEDLAVCMPLLEAGVPVFSAELVLSGIVVQRLDYESHRLFLDPIKRTRSSTWFEAAGNRRSAHTDKSKKRRGS